MDAGPALLKAWRIAAGLSQDAARNRLPVPVAQNTWSDWENGEKSPRVSQCISLHVLTEGACPVWSWSEDSETRAELERALMASVAAAPTRAA